MASTSNGNRSYAAAHFAVELDGLSDIGMFRSVEGGGMKADVMTNQTGGSHVKFRQLGKPHFDDLKLTVGMAGSKPFYKWISEFFTGQGTRKSGSIIAADFYYQERARRTFSGALIKEVSFPKLDASDKSAAYMNVGISVENIEFKVGSGESIDQRLYTGQQRLWTSCNFRFSLSGFEDNCKRCSKVDAFTIRQTVIEHNVGGYRSPFKFPSQMDFPNLSFYVPEADAAPFYERATQGIRNGVSGKQLHGQIEILDNGFENVLASVAFTNCDIVSVTPDRQDATTEDIKLVKVEIYSEMMSFDYGPIGLGALE
jgi:phage tail-like protein